MADNRLDQRMSWEFKQNAAESQSYDGDGPFDLGYLAWNYHPSIGTVTGTAIANTYVAYCRVRMPGDLLITNVEYNVATKTTTPTTGQCFIGIYSAAGVLLGQTADLASVWDATASYKVSPLTTPLAVSGLSNPYIFVGFQFNGSTGPALTAKTAGASTTLLPYALNGHLAAPNFKFGVSVAGAGTTALPATMAANAAVTTQVVAAAYWVALT